MSRNVLIAKSFKKDMAKHLIHFASAEWAEVLHCLIEKKPLPEKYRDHQLQGNLKEYRDCHVKPDLVLLYKIVDNDETLQLHYIDTHAQVFKKAK